MPARPPASFHVDRHREVGSTVSQAAADASVALDRLQVPCVRAEAPLARAVAVFRDRRCAFAIVVRLDGRPLGLVTARGVCLVAMRKNLPLSDVLVRDAMTRTLDAADGQQRRELRSSLRHMLARARARERGPRRRHDERVGAVSPRR